MRVQKFSDTVKLKKKIRDKNFQPFQTLFNYKMNFKDFENFTDGCEFEKVAKSEHF